ncbi:MAG TPA: 2-amino-4-hydroxy-6-hydroxymethyldihydropteridine diphosphokinase [Candidatus Baltobacteraceae bacterium]
MALAYLGIGSNVGDPVANVKRAIVSLASLGRLVAWSSLYRTKAWGVREQADFINAAVALETELPPIELLAALKELERNLGRTPTYRWGPRTIDLDILTYGGFTIELPDLVIPHPRLFERAFALAPLAELDAAFAVPLDSLAPQARAEVERLERPKHDDLPWHL